MCRGKGVGQCGVHIGCGVTETPTGPRELLTVWKYGGGGREYRNESWNRLV